MFEESLLRSLVEPSPGHFLALGEISDGDKHPNVLEHGDFNRRHIEFKIDVVRRNVLGDSHMFTSPYWA